MEQVQSSVLQNLNVPCKQPLPIRAALGSESKMDARAWSGSEGKEKRSLVRLLQAPSGALTIRKMLRNVSVCFAECALLSHQSSVYSQIDTFLFFRARSCYEMNASQQRACCFTVCLSSSSEGLLSDLLL